MKQSIAHITLVVDDYNEAIKFYTEKLDFTLLEDTAYETGTAVYEFTVGGQPQTLERRYFTVWKRQSKSGAWKIHSNVGIAKD